MLRLGLGPQIGTNTPADSGGEQVIWKVAIFGAGTTSSNGEYVWDGTTTFNGKPKYSFGLNEIFWAEILGTFKWVMYEDNVGDAYTSDDLISWVLENGDSPAPSSALSYAQDSFISSLTLAGADSADINGQYSRASGGLASFSGPATGFGNASIDWDSGSSAWAVTNGDEQKYGSIDLFSWYALAGGEPVPTATAIVYSA